MSSFIEINIMCIILLVLILSQSLFETNKRQSLQLFNRLALSMLLAISSDFIFYLLQGHQYSGNIIISYLANSLYFIGMLFGTYYGLRYIIAIILGVDNISGKLKGILLTPLIILFIIVATNGFHHMLFTIDITNNYFRGPLLELCALVILSYLILAIGICIYNYYATLLKDQKSVDRKLMLYLLLPLIGGYTQYKYYGINATVPSIVLTLLMIYINTLKNEVNYDALTQLYNRRQFDKYMLAKYQQGQNRAFLVFIDIDRFKEINDLYGHLQGDKALIDVANGLKRAFIKEKAFVARYGGDEFAIIIDCDIAKLKTSLVNLQMALINDLDISISYGYCPIDCQSYVDINQIIKVADHAMYQHKHSKKEH